MNQLRRLWWVLAAASVLAGCDCGRECTSNSDCASQGPNFVCQAGRCVDDTPDAGPQCSPACATNQFCETATLTCKSCSATRGCTGTQVCDTAANGGAGQCRNCAPSTDGGVAPGCNSQLPACDPAANGGSGQCVRCTAAGGCGAAICDTSVDGGVCRACLPSVDGGAVAPGCTAPEPICNTQQDRCITCTATAGCAGDQGICDQAANGGKGLCRTCVASTDGGTAPGCAAGSPVCDPAGDGGTGACVICTSVQGCTAPQFCDPAAGMNRGQCKNCVDSTDGGRDPGCTSGAPVCNTAADGGVGTCIGCIVSADCTIDPNRVCDPATNSCKVCILVPAPEGCAGMQVCDPLANGGQGACLGCNGDPDCGGATPRCRTTPPPGTCVECLADPDCTNTARPACNSTTNVCGCTASSQCVTNPTRVCDTAANSGNGQCVVCTPAEGCTDPKAPACKPDGTACQCPNSSVCDVNEVCTGDPATCMPVSPTSAEAAIAQFLASADGPLAAPITISGAYATYLKPAGPNPADDPAGFFLQATPGGASVFVAVDPAGLTPAPIVGDRIQVTALTKATFNGVRRVTAIDTASTDPATRYQILSSMHPVRNLDTGMPRGLVVDVSSRADLITALASYESDLIRLTGTIAPTGFGFAGNGHLSAQFTTAGIPLPNANLRLRLPDGVRSDLDLVAGCRFTLHGGVMWRFNNQAQPSSYSRTDFSGITCPAPRVLSAIALSSTSVEVSFDRLIDPASVQPSDFAISGLMVTAAAASGRTVTLTTDAQVQDQAYTVAVSGVTDSYGTPVNPAANTASFYGYAAPGASAGLVINEIDYDQNVNPDSTEFVELVNIGAGPVSLAGIELVLVSGGNTATPRREYARYRLDRVTDGTNPAVTVPAGGVVVVGAASVVNPLPAGTLRMAITTPAGGQTDIIQNAGSAMVAESDGAGLIHYATGTLVDSIFYEPSTQGPTFTIGTGAGDQAINFEEGTRTAAFDSATAAGSLERRKAGMPAVPQDTNDNNADFAFAMTPTPGTP